MPTSHETLLRRVKQFPVQPAPAPRIIGIDDWAWRKGQRYGTILVDLERRTVLDLLPDRGGPTLQAWLKEQPQIELISRDRSGTYAQAASAATPQAKQLAFDFIRRPEEREADKRAQLDAARAASADLDGALNLADEVAAMLRRTTSQPLSAWLAKAVASGFAEMRGFAHSLSRDEAAVAAALTEDWSNGPVEGHVNRLKVIKRPMFGRAGFELLRARAAHGLIENSLANPRPGVWGDSPNLRKNRSEAPIGTGASQGTRG